ncbi:hypothetical protein VTI74DRAFT_3508 [Chaetomium olivicolor]
MLPGATVPKTGLAEPSPLSALFQLAFEQPRRGNVKGRLGCSGRFLPSPLNKQPRLVCFRSRRVPAPLFTTTRTRKIILGFITRWKWTNGEAASLKLRRRQGRCDVKDNDGRTPLWWAIVTEHDAIVKLLLGIGKADVNAKDNRGRTLLSLAGKYGHEAVVKLLGT